MRSCAAVRCVDKDVKIYEACGKYAAIGEDEALREKLRRFLAQLEMLRSRVPYTPIHELITQILEETGYGGYASAMPGGVQRRANLEMLVEKAVEFEATSYRGLFNFIRYIEQLQKYEVDFGEVNIYGESADTVRIMSIHKSKGLEFPVVFLSGHGQIVQPDGQPRGARTAFPDGHRRGCDRSGAPRPPGDTAAADHPAEHEAGKSGGGTACALRCDDAAEGEADYDRAWRRSWKAV